MYVSVPHHAVKTTILTYVMLIFDPDSGVDGAARYA